MVVLGSNILIKMYYSFGRIETNWTMLSLKVDVTYSVIIKNIFFFCWRYLNQRHDNFGVFLLALLNQRQSSPVVHIWTVVCI